MRASAAADRDHDFQLVAVCQQNFTMLTARHDLAIALDGYALAGIAEGFDQPGDRERGVKAAAIAVDGQG